MPARLWSAPAPGKGLHIGTWSDDAHWDSRTGQFLFFGVRQTRKFVAYSETNNAWRVIDFVDVTNAPVLLQQFGHQYSGNGLDPVRSHFYTNGRRYDLLTGEWTILPSWKKQEREKSMTISYVTGMDGLGVLIFQDPGRLRILKPGSDSWVDVAKLPVHGYHSVARDNPMRKEVLFAGGNDSRAVVVVRADGSVKRLKDYPEASITIRHTFVTVDPLSGRFLFHSPGNKLYELDSERDEYRLIDDFKETRSPFEGEESKVVAFIPEYGVTMWAGAKVHLYKHNAAGNYPVIEGAVVGAAE
jgi:hypothetical protein